MWPLCSPKRHATSFINPVRPPTSPQAATQPAPPAAPPAGGPAQAPEKAPAAPGCFLALHTSEASPVAPTNCVPASPANLAPPPVVVAAAPPSASATPSKRPRDEEPAAAATSAQQLPPNKRRAPPPPPLSSLGRAEAGAWLTANGLGAHAGALAPFTGKELLSLSAGDLESLSLPRPHARALRRRVREPRPWAGAAAQRAAEIADGFWGSDAGGGGVSPFAAAALAGVAALAGRALAAAQGGCTCGAA